MADDKKVENEDKQEVKKEVLSAPKMAYQLIGSFLIWGVVLYLPISLVEELATSWMKSVWLRFPCMAVLEGIAVIYLWKLSNIRVFKKRTIRPNKVNAVMKYLIIATILATVFCSWTNIRTAKKEVHEEVAEEFRTTDLYVKIFSRMYSDEEKAEYGKLKKEYEDKAEHQTLVLSIVFAAIISMVDLGALFIEKRDLEKIVRLEWEE